MKHSQKKKTNQSRFILKPNILLLSHRSNNVKAMHS